MKMLGENLFPYEEEIKLHMFSVRMENGMWHTYLSMLYMSISRQGGGGIVIGPHGGVLRSHID